MIRILVADDHAVVREGVKQILANLDDMKVSGEAGSGPETLAMLDRQDYDLVLLDISMPGRSGLEILEDIRNVRPKLPVLVLSMHPEEQYALRALRAGAAGYLTKASAPQELIGAIRKAAKGGKYVTASLAEKLAFQLDMDAVKPRHETLSNRELQIMLMIAAGKSVSEIAAELSLSVKTVSTYRVRLLAKLGMKTNAEMMRFAIEEGLAD
jgi:DNA-binding NarL/FixJ family response regulator